MPFKILALDGGGARGIYSAHVLRRVCEEFHITPSIIFDLLIGTSTGAIIAASAAIDYDLAKLCAEYEESAPRIFSPALFNGRGILASRYSQVPLKSLLSTVFGTRTLGEIACRLVIPATDISNGNVYVFKSAYDPSFVRDRATSVVTAVLASCAAPLFFDPVAVGPYLVADGGIWANNPSMVGLTEGLGRLQQKLEDIRILSIGTGRGQKYYDPTRGTKGWWGFATGWGDTKLVDTALNLQSRSAENSAQLILKNNYLRINFESDNELGLDDVSIMASLKAKADQDFTYKSASIKTLLGLP